MIDRENRVQRLFAISRQIRATAATKQQSRRRAPLTWVHKDCREELAAILGVERADANALPDAAE